MINHFNFKKFKDKNLITNDMGQYMLLPDEDFEKLIHDKINENSPYYEELSNKAFVYNTDNDVFIEKNKDCLRCCKGYLGCATSLHIFVVTNTCNMNCGYCQAHFKEKSHQGKMSIETAKKAVEIALSSPTLNLTFEFQGGEPLINFETIKFIVEYSKQMKSDERFIDYTIVSNLTLLTDEITEFCVNNNISISTSLDGNSSIHNYNRPFANGGNTFDTVVEKIKLLQKKKIFGGAIQTTTKYSLERYKDIIDTYVSLGIKSVFLRPLTPLGTACANWDEIGYTTDSFKDFYSDSIRYMLHLNKDGICVKETHAEILLRKILTGNPVNYMELRSPCGASIGQMAYYYDGNVFTCDEGRMIYEMGDASFKLGTVNNSYDELMNSSVCKAVSAASVLESLPGCSDCPYNIYCGVCPVINFALEKDIYAKAPNNYRCRLYGRILDTIFDILAENNEQSELLKLWIK